MEKVRKSTYLNSAVEIEGYTLFSGKPVKVRLTTPLNIEGIYFKRVDIPDSEPIKAVLNNVWKTPRTTIIGDEKASVALIEHLMASLYAFNIKNALIEIDGPEVPIGDGSALHIVDAILKSSPITEKERKFLSLSQAVSLENLQQVQISMPSEEFKITYVLNYPPESLINDQIHTFSFDLMRFIDDIAPARTFALKSEVDQMVRCGIIKSKSLDAGLVIDNGVALNPKGLRFHDEMARHKILDFLGDFALADLDVSMHNVSIRAGHQANIEFAKKIKNHFKETVYDA